MTTEWAMFWIGMGGGTIAGLLFGIVIGAWAIAKYGELHKRINQMAEVLDAIRAERNKAHAELAALRERLRELGETDK